MSVHIDKIRLDGGTQSRAAISDATVADYAEAMADPNTVFPPITLYFDGADYWLADGFHRLAAWRQIGRTDIPADVRQGDRRRAILHSVAANSAHGLRRTNEDKRRAVLTLLEDQEWAQWSDREIARKCAVSNDFVSRTRRSLSSNDSENAMEIRSFTTKHGTPAKMNTDRIGGQPPARPEPVHLIEDEPATDQPADDKIDRKLRRHFRDLTAQAQEDDWVGLKRALHDEKVECRKLRSEINRLKEGLKLYRHEDKNAVIRALEKEVEHKNSEMFRANDKFSQEKKVTYALRKRIEELERQAEWVSI